MTSDSVTQTRWRNSVATGSEVNSERPSEPWKSPSSQCQYCTNTGCSRPSLRSRAWYCASVCPAPKMRTAGSPGMKATVMKVSTVTKKNSGIEIAILRRRKATISLPLHSPRDGGGRAHTSASFVIPSTGTN